MADIDQGAVTTSADISQAVNIDFDIVATPDSGETSRVLLVVLNLRSPTDEGGFGEVSDMTVTSDLAGDVGQHFLLDLLFNAFGVLVFAQAIPDDFDGDVTFTLQMTSAGGSPANIRYGVTTFWNVLPECALLATNFDAHQQTDYIPDTIPLAVQLDPPAAGDVIVAIGSGVTGFGASATLNGEAADTTISLAVGGDIVDNIVSFQAPAADIESGLITYTGTNVFPHTVLGFAFQPTEDAGGGGGENTVDDMNCECEAESPYRPMSELKKDLMVELGFAAQKDNPPPGMDDWLVRMLQKAHKQILRTNPDLRTTKFFSWPLEQGIRYYGVANNAESCGLKLRADQVKWVGWEDGQGVWTELYQGIDPTWYTTRESTGRPSHYEIRSCIEIFCGPSATEGRLWIKGDFDVTPFDNPEHKPSVDDEAVLLLAVAFGCEKYDKGRVSSALRIAGNYVLSLRAGKHHTRRYVPGMRRLPPATRPTMTEFISG